LSFRSEAEESAFSLGSPSLSQPTDTPCLPSPKAENLLFAFDFTQRTTEYHWTPMGLQFPKLILLPGMDGTGELFAEFIRALPVESETEALRYPADRFLSYEQLMALTQSVLPASEPFVLVAESFSTPLAMQLAATNPPNLKGIVLCAGFVTSPVRGRLRRLGVFFSPVLFSAGLPESAARYWLTGSSVSPTLLASVRAAISSVRPAVLSARLRAVLTCDASVELEKIAVPILYLQAKKDRLVKESSLNEIRRIKPKTVAVVIPGPHLLFQLEPQRAAEVVMEFVRQLP
jgi:pimeloyl-[acyl-carrier protein] methyl ester esterase